MSLPLFLLLMAAVAALIGYTIWSFFAPAPLRRTQADEHVQEMTRKVQEVGETIARINAAHKAAYESVEAAPRDGDPRTVFDDYMRHAPDPRLRYDLDVLRKRFDETDHSPWLAVAAGMALKEFGRGGVDEALKRDAVKLVLERGDAATLGWLAEGMLAQMERPGGLDQWIARGGSGRSFADAISRMRPRSPAIAERLAALAGAVDRRGETLLMEKADSVIARFEPLPGLEDSYATASELVRLCIPPFPPGIAGRVDDVVDRNAAHADWRQVRLQMDLILIEHDLHPDAGAAMTRIEAALDDRHASVVDTAGEVASDLIEQGLLELSLRPSLHDAVERAKRRLDALPGGLARLDALLDGPPRS